MFSGEFNLVLSPRFLLKNFWVCFSRLVSQSVNRLPIQKLQDYLLWLLLNMKSRTLLNQSWESCKRKKCLSLSVWIVSNVMLKGRKTKTPNQILRRFTLGMLFSTGHSHSKKLVSRFWSLCRSNLQVKQYRHLKGSFFVLWQIVFDTQWYCAELKCDY